MDWVAARERLGAELIGAREGIVERWRQSLREQGALAWAIDLCAAELVLQAGAALADGMPPWTPWRSCGGLLRIDARESGLALAREISLLWEAMSVALARLPLTLAEDRLVREELGRQQEAALRGADAEHRGARRDQAVDEPLRFGGPVAVCWNPLPADEPAERAA